MPWINESTEVVFWPMESRLDWDPRRDVLDHLIDDRFAVRRHDLDMDHGDTATSV